MCWKIGNNYFLSKLILYLLGQEYGIYFSFLTYIFSRYLWNIYEKKFGPTKYPPKKVSDPRNTHEKKFGSTKYPRKKLRTHEGTVAQWYETHEAHDGTRPTEFSTLDNSLLYAWLVEGLLLKMLKYFDIMLNMFEFSYVKEIVESWLVYLNKFSWIIQLCFLTETIKQSF